MLRQDEQGYTPLSGMEYTELQRVMALLNGLDEVYALNERIGAIKYGKRDLACIKRLSGKLLEGILRTIPKNKVQRIRDELPRLTADVRIRGAATPEKQEVLLVPFDALVALMGSAIEQSCYLCSKTEKEGRKCKLYRQICACLPYKPNSKGDGFCPLAGSACLEEKGA